ncbi:MAG: hypothetical protein NTY47_08480 [Candidatus Omnitrophica bacterium]|nr:hypothetical protein [Candidatus Omnitrophota bacterium]
MRLTNVESLSWAIYEQLADDNVLEIYFSSQEFADAFLEHFSDNLPLVLEYLIWHGLREIELILQGRNSIDAHDRSLRETPAKYRKIMDRIEQFFFDQAQEHKCLAFPWLTIDDISAETLDRCKSGDYSVLALDWNLRIWDYQKFITYACGLNTAMKAMLETLTDFSLEAIQAAITLRIDMIQHYDAALTKEGEQALQEEIQDPVMTLTRLINPPKEWFVPFWNQLANSVPYIRQTGQIVPTSGCTTQCDHCSEATGINFHSIPSPRVEEINRPVSGLRRDIFRDRSDFVYDAGMILFMMKTPSH